MNAPQRKIRSRIAGTGAYLPKRILTNAELEKMVDTTDEWITSRTGIKERRIAAENEFTSDLGAKAAIEALRHAKVKPEAVDLIIVATFSPDTGCASTACRIQHAIGATRAGAFDLQAACSGFLYALVVADQMIGGGLFKNVLVIGAEKTSSLINWKDRNTCVIFGDGAGAVLLQPTTEGRGLLASELGSDGSKTDLLTVPGGGCRIPVSPESLAQGKNFLIMAGKEIFKLAVNAMNESSTHCLEKAGVKPSQLAWVIPHQANLRIVSAVADRFELPSEKFYVNLHRYGNMSAACIPVALHELETDGKLKRGDLLLLTAFGGGLTWASIVLEW